MIDNFRYLLLFILIFCSLTVVRAYIVQVYDNPDNLYFISSSSDVKYGFTYPNGTGLMQLLNPNNGNNTDNNLYIRLLHLDGTLTKFTVPLVCDTFCIQRAYPLNDGYVFVTLTSSNKSAHGTLVDWSGRVLQRYQECAI